MKLKALSILSAFLMVLGSCNDEQVVKVVENPVRTGEEINFGSYLPDQSKIETRTFYGDAVETGGLYNNGYFPVYWEDGDQITILCPEASNGTRVDYEITPMEGNEYTSTDVTKVDQDKAGLQWGNADVHHFYAFYPAQAVREGDDNPTDGVVTVNIPAEQNPVRWEKDEDGTLVGIGNTDYAYMWAYAEVDRDTLEQGTPIPLKFEPMSTVLEITVNGPISGKIAISSINVNSIDETGTGEANTILTGEVKCDIKAATTSENHQAKCEAAGDMNAVRNRIYISLYGAEKDASGNDTYPVLEPGDKLRVYAYLLPKDEDILKGRLQISVSPVNQANKIKTLETADVKAHAINRVNLPALDAESASGGHTDINYWMSSLDPDIYLTELSWPGSKMSMATYENDNNYFLQSSSLTEQFELGVRAFDLQTIVRNTGNPFNPNYEMYVATENQLQGTPITTLQNALKELTTCLRTAKEEGKLQETVFVNLSYSVPRFKLDFGFGDLGDLFRNEPEWKNRLISTLNNWANEEYVDVYGRKEGEVVTANTTLGDVAGKIVLRVHIKETDAYSKFDSQLPAQLVCYNDPYNESPVSMSWGIPETTNGLQLLYQEATRIDNGGGILDLTDFDGTAQTKKDQVAAIVQESVQQYNTNEEHNIWYMMDLGGYYYAAAVGGLFGERCNSVGVAEDLTPHFFQYFNTREQNASLGTVYMNFADNNPDYGAKYGCDYLIQTIIDNNFSFPLRTRPGTSSSSRAVPVQANSDPNKWD